MWPFKSKPKRERGVPTLPGGWRTNLPAGGLTPVGHTGDPVSLLSSEWSGPLGPHAAENLAAVLANVQAIAGAVGSLPAYVVKADDRAPRCPLIIRFRNSWTTGPTTRCRGATTSRHLLASALLHGDALSSIEADDRGRLARPARASSREESVRPLLTEHDTLRFFFFLSGPLAGKTQRLGRADCIFLKDGSDDEWLGVSRLSQSARRDADCARVADAVERLPSERCEAGRDAGSEHQPGRRPAPQTQRGSRTPHFAGAASTGNSRCCRPPLVSTRRCR